jgi:hypothetical protein
MNATKIQPEMEPAAEISQDSEGKREISKIAFPYDDLDSAVQIARAIHELTGSESEIEQIAGHLRQSPKSSGLRVQIASAKTFGLTTNAQGKVSLTRLGTQICDQQQEKLARSEAFLAVPLYKEVYEKFRGVSLPPDAALETVMVGMGVAQKQKERARQVLRRSAQQAGFFQFGTDRLVAPAIKASAAPPVITSDGKSEESADEPREKRRKTQDSGGEEYHPFIQGLLKKLPPPETDWPMEARAKWLQAAINIFDLMYLDTDDSRRSLGIELKKDSAK